MAPIIQPRQKSKYILGVMLCFIYMALNLHDAFAQHQTAGRLVHYKGPVEVSSQGEKGWRPAIRGQLLEIGDVLRTGPHGWAAILGSDETLLQLNHDTQLVFKAVAPSALWLTSSAAKSLKGKRESGSSIYQLNIGEIWLRNKNKEASILIEAPNLSAHVRGTELDLLVLPEDTVIMTVQEGFVKALHPQGAIQVVSREQLVVRSGLAPQKEALLTPGDAVQWTLFIPPLKAFHKIPFISNDQSYLLKEQDRIKASLSADPGSITFRLDLAGVFYDQGRFLEAENLFEQVLMKHSGHADALTGLGFVCLETNRPEEALKIFTKNTLPVHPKIILGRSMARAQLGYLDEALAELESSASRFHDYLPFRIQQAVIALEKKEIKKAGTLLEDLVRQHPGYSPAWNLLALNYTVLGNKIQALEASRKGVETDPRAPVALLTRSYALQASFDLDQATKVTRRALELDPENVSALVNLARLRFSCDYLAEARRVIEKARRIEPRNAEAQSLRGFIMLAKGETDAAMAAFSQAIRLNPSLGEPYLGLGILHMRRGKVAPAMEAISTAVLLEPQRSMFLSYWGKMLFQLKRFDKALDMLEQAAILDSHDPTPHYYKAVILKDLNRPAEAIQSLNKSIALNNNRAVYRSRFLLDRDLASRNVDLAQTYNELGLSAWAWNKAMASTKQNYADYSAHLFLAGALSGLTEMEGRVRAAGSEILLAGILQPANVNSFNTFNDYTTLFENPSLSTTLACDLGNHNSVDSNILSNGALPALNLAFGGLVSFSESDGWRGTYDQERYSLSGALKWDPALYSSFYLAAYHSEDRYKDWLVLNEYDQPSIPDNGNKTRQTDLEFGYHHHFSPRADLLVYFAYDGYDEEIEYPFDGGTFFFDPAIALEAQFFQARKTPSFEVQGHQLFKLGGHQIGLGIHQYWEDTETRLQSTVYFNYRGAGYPSFASRTDYNMERQCQSYYIQDTWQPTPWATLEAAFYYDSMKTGDPFAGTQWNRERLNPRFGVALMPTDSDTFRLAAFRYLVPFTYSRLDPMDVAGVCVYRTNLAGTLAEEIDLVWEHEWSRGYLYANIFRLQQESVVEYISEGDLQAEKTETLLRGLEFAWNQLIGQGLGLAVTYGYKQAADKMTLLASKKKYEDHIVTTRLKYLHPSGLFASLTQIFRDTEMKEPDTDDETASSPHEDLWITDVKIGYELPLKAGRVSLEIRNVFDNHFNWFARTELLPVYGRAPAREIVGSFSYNF